MFSRFSPVIFVAICGLLLHLVPALAGPLSPCTAATLSANGSILVVTTMAFDDTDETHARYPRTSTFKIMPRYGSLNQGQGINGPNAYWAHTLWSITLKDVSCPFTLVTDDGEYLVLIGKLNFALTIYRRRDYPGQPLGGPGEDHGVLVRQIPLAALWPPEKIPEGVFSGSPEWFSSGTFAFSPDNRILVYKTEWGKTLEIRLATGEINNK